MIKKMPSINTLFVGSGLIILTILGFAAWYYTHSLQQQDAQQLKGNVEVLRSSLASAVFMAQLTDEGKTLSYYSQDSAGQYAEAAADSDKAFLATQYQTDVSDKAMQASGLAEAYGRTMSAMIQHDDIRDGARSELPRLRQLLQAVGELEDTL